MSVPQVPPRPARAQHTHVPVTAVDLPKVPPRPSQRRASDRSQSPNPENFPRSPFNDLPHGAGIGRPPSRPRSAAGQNDVDVPRRPPSVSLPSVGQEGSEYANLGDHTTNGEEAPIQETNTNDPKETRNVAGDLPLHAPKPSLAKDDAKKRVANVTRTDSSQAAAVGYGKAPTPSSSTDPERGRDNRTVKSKVSFRTASTDTTERPSSTQPEDDHGIPEIGQRVPMYPDAGDVQAPSPAPGESPFPAGIGFHNTGGNRSTRHHRRTPSGREVLPPGSYGLHGHGVAPADQFEQQWYAKHPEALEREEPEYGPGIGGGRGEWALSREDLNKIVYDTAKSAKHGSSIPNEQIGYEASEEYVSRMQTPHSATFRLSHPNSSQPHVESPLRKASFPVDADAANAIRKVQSYEAHRKVPDQALDSETEDDDVYVSPPATRSGKYNMSGYDRPTEDLGPDGGNTDERGGFVEETGYGVPILASDEVARTPGAEYQHPAVSPPQSRRGSAYLSSSELEMHGLAKGHSWSGSAANSRPSSRPGSVHGLSLSRFSTLEDDRDIMHTPLEDVEEYEPLFPEDEHGKPRKPMTAAERLKLREQMKRFPSQDIWEDTPNSLQLQATVDTPEPTQQATTTASAFETPEQEAARKGEVTEAERSKMLPKGERLAKSAFKPQIEEEMHRPGMKQRFPSRDIWEDSPDSAELTTTVSHSNDPAREAGAVVHTSERQRDGTTGEAVDAGADGTNEKPSIPPRPTGSKAGASPPLDAAAKPTIPARPVKQVSQPESADDTELKRELSGDSRKGPAIPDRPKPQVPSRPAKGRASDASDNTLTKVTSTSSAGSDGGAPPKPAKPVVPTRPTGSKIAALQGGFMADLNSRLKLGPKPVEKESPPPAEEEDKAPLSDARRSRAKGPARKKPSAPASDPAPATAKWSISVPATLWETTEDGSIQLQSPSSDIVEEKEEASTAEGGVSIPEDKAATASHPAVEQIMSDTPGPLSDLPTPAKEEERNPLSMDPSPTGVALDAQQEVPPTSALSKTTLPGEGGIEEAEQ